MNDPQQYNSVAQNDLDSTRDDLEEERQKIEAQRNELTKTNLFKTRVIESEINSSLTFQITLYFNFYYSLLCFVLQVSSISYKLYIYNIDKFAIVRICLVVIWIFVEQVRLYYGYKSNIQESFYHFLLFILISIIFATPFQVILIVGNSDIFPMDYATTIIFLLFLLLELIFCARAMARVSKRQSAMYFLRNTQTLVLRPEEKIKTSKEIEEELYIKFPNLKRNRPENSASQHQKVN